MCSFFTYSFVRGADYDYQIASSQRNPFRADWNVGVSKDRMLKVLDADVYNNSGRSLNLSGAIIGLALTYMDSSSWIPHVHFRGHVCKTKPPLTLLSVAFAFKKATTLHNAL